MVFDTDQYENPLHLGGPRCCRHTQPYGSLTKSTNSPLACGSSLDTTGNYCAEQLRRNGDGTSDGSTVFVYVDCDTRLPLPMEKQTSSIYKRPGVSRKRGGQYAYALSLGRQAGTASGSDAGPYVHLQEGSDCSTSSKTLVTCYDWPEDKCCQSGLAQKNAVYFGGNTDTLVNYQNWISDNPTGAPEEYCTTIKGSGQADDQGAGVCVSGETGTGGASWSKIIGCPSFDSCSGPGRRSLENNQTISATSQQPAKCKERAFGDHLAYPKEGGVLVIPGEWVEKWKHILAALPANNAARVEKFDEMGALYYSAVAEYSSSLNEDGTSKN
ncbi:hypothetical protein PENPOL_c021G02246 [Penicillium polonicum]|uniref:Uncharacterized protein n=1 Tax=Penicillium polonicum TaxID=60169 RepID=A0A1V6N7M8_PENPO|nr:hypothetical protein PENPOL_c021G02246 [Penicillium polonicum]